MRRFVAEQNVRHFKRLLESEGDLDQHALVSKLLTEAEWELAEAEHEFEESEKTARLRDAAAHPTANDPSGQHGAQRSPGSGRR